MPRKRRNTSREPNGFTVEVVGSKLRKREPNGRLQRETVDAIRGLPDAASRRPAVGAVSARLRMGIPLIDVLDPLCGWAFGRMKMHKVVSADQYEAGLRWEAVVGREARRLGVPRPYPKSPSATLLARSSGISGEDMTPEWCARTREDYDNAFSALRDEREGNEMLVAMKRIILMDEFGSVGALRSGLNVLIRIWY